MITFDQQLRTARLKAGLTQRQCDALLGVPGTQVARWEQGRNVPGHLTQEAALARLDRARRAIAEARASNHRVERTETTEQPR